MKGCSTPMLMLGAMMMAGCWTFNESEYPRVEITGVPEGKNISLAVNGFAATVTEYATYSEFHTVYVPGHCGRHHYHPGYFETVPTVAYVPQARTTDTFLRRAKDELEQAGFTLAAPTPDWTLDVEFTGPIVSSSDSTKELCWMIGTVFFCDYGAATWTAKLRLRDNRTGKLVFHHDYARRYETNVFGLIPIFSISAAQQTSLGYMQSWCLGALTDQIVADVASFLAKK